MVEEKEAARAANIRVTGGRRSDVGKQLRQFFTDLLDEHEPARVPREHRRYVASQVKAGVIKDAAARLILDGRLQDIEDNIKLVTGSGSAVPVCIVLPPF